MTLRTHIMMCAALIYVGITAFRVSVSAGLDHDEHQFMASAFLVAEQGLHPYHDFPYFHMPNLTYLYAIFFLLTDYPFLAIRLFSGLCAIGISVVVFFVSSSLFSATNRRIGLMIAVSSSVLFANSELYSYATSHVWNHTPSTLCAMLAFVFHCQAIQRCMAWRYFLLSGFLLGLAIGIRLSFAPLVLPFMAIMFLSPPSGSKRRLFGLIAFGVGGLVANAPAIYFLTTCRQQFLFGNLGYAKLNTLYRQELGYERAMTLWGKVLYLRDVFSPPGNLLIVVVAVYGFIGIEIKRLGELIMSGFELQFLLLVLPFLCIGSFAPTPLWSQYFFALLAFIILVPPYALAYLQKPNGQRFGAHLLVLAAILSSAFGAFPKTRTSILSIFRPKDWFPVRLHDLSAEEIANNVVINGKGGMVLTLAPLYAVEAGLPVYRQSVTGPFAWRVGHLLSPADRWLYSVVTSAEIGLLLERDPPAAILTNTGQDEDLEKQITRAARNLGYHQRTLSNGSIIWIPPP